jgi:RNA polymerase-binding transcription factor DksA
MRFDPSTVQQLHRALLARGETLATLLSEVLAGKDEIPALTSAGIDVQPGIHPKEALRKALDQVERRRILLDAGDDRYGRCDECGGDLGEVAVVELPWADRCVAHAATAREWRNTKVARPCARLLPAND